MNLVLSFFGLYFLVDLLEGWGAGSYYVCYGWFRELFIGDEVDAGFFEIQRF